MIRGSSNRSFESDRLVGRSRRGFTLIEMAAVGLLLSVASTLAIALTLRLTDQSRRREALQVEAQTLVELRRVLRRDVRSASVIEAVDNGLRLTIDGQPVTLTGGESLTRSAGGYTMALPTPRGSSRLRREGNVVVWSHGPPPVERAGSAMAIGGASVPWQVVVAVPEGVR